MMPCMSLRALLVGPANHGGGESVYVRMLAAHPPPGVDCVLAGAFGAGADGVRCRRIAEVALNRIVHPRTLPDMGFRALAVGSHFDVVHVHAHRAHLRGRAEVPLVMSEGSCVVVYLRDYLGWSEEQLRERVTRSRSVYRRLGVSDRLLALDGVAYLYVFSEWARELNLAWGADPSKVRVIPPGFAVPAAVSRAERATFTFLFVGSDFERKGGFEVIEAFDDLRRTHPHVRLLLAGSDPLERNPDRAIHSWVDAERRERAVATLGRLEREGLASRLPWVDRGRLTSEIYPAADAFVMPTHAEGFGFTNVEAMSFGLPVITSSAGPSAEIVDDGHSGLIVPPGDVEGLIAAMDKLAADPTTAREMGERGRESFLARFTLDRFRSDLGALYREVAGM
jgi:glycosyltransferase involved in cell wall biosynthesis